MSTLISKIHSLSVKRHNGTDGHKAERHVRRNLALRMAFPLICAALYAPSAHAQVGESRSTLAIGINGGMNMNTVNFTPTIDQNSLNGVTGGITLRYTCEKYFATVCAVQLELNYSQQGWLENIDDGSNNTYQRTIDYVQVPIFAHLGWGREERGVQFFVNAGPQFGFYLSDKETYGGDPWDTSNRPNSVTEQYGKDIEKTFDYGIAGGAGIDLATKIGHFTLEGRYYYGFGNIFGDTKKDPFGNSNHTVISVRLGYLLDIFKGR